MATDHLWLHFTRMGGDAPPIIVRGDGCYLEDIEGKRYLDALAGLFSVNLGYGFGEEIGQAALEQMRELPFYTNWSYAHPRAIELAAEVASLAPGDLNRVFFVSGGSEAVEAAWKLARQYYQLRGAKRVHDVGGLDAEIRHDEHLAGPPGRRYKAIAREVAYHGTTFGALSINGIAALRTPFEPLVPEVRHVSNTNRYHRPPDETEEQFTAFLLDELERTITAWGPRPSASSSWSRCRTPAARSSPPEGYWRGVREICDRYDILLSADEVITGFGRVGHWFASERYDIRPDIITCAKGLSSSYAAIGAVIATDRVMEPFLAGDVDVLARDHVRRASRDERDRAQEHRDHEAGADHRARPRQRGRLPHDARAAARPADRRRRARHGLLLRARAREGQGDARDVLRRGVRDAAARLPLAAAVREGPHLPGRRPRRPGDPDLAAAHRDAGGVRRDDGSRRRLAEREVLLRRARWQNGCRDG